MSAQQLQACLEGCAVPVRNVATVLQQEAERFQVSHTLAVADAARLLDAPLTHT